MSVRRVTTAERRARLQARHHLGGTADGVLDAVRDLVAVHSSDPIAPYLGIRARVTGTTTADIDEVLYEQRSLWRLHAMRRTLFVVDAEEVPMLDAAVGQDVAARERRRLHGWLAAEMPADRVEGWLADLELRVATTLAGGGEWRTSELATIVEGLGTQITLGSGRWATRAPLSSRLLFLLAAEGRVVRTRPAGSWRSSQYRWADPGTWFGTDRRGQAGPTTSRPARTTLARRYLARYGPATADDLRWWSGWTVARTRRALEDADTVPVALDDDGEGWVLADDVAPTDAGGDHPTVALLPALDTTPMGWKERAWYLGTHGDQLFDGNGNVGPTVWVDGRVVGGWAQRPDGEVVVRLLEDVGSEAAGRVAVQAAALTTWLAGEVAIPRFRTPLERELSS